MAESITMCQALRAGCCPQGMTKFLSMGFGYAAPVSVVINILDDAYSRIVMDAIGKSCFAKDSSSDVATKVDVFERQGRSSKRTGYSEPASSHNKSTGEYGITQHGNGYAFCHRTEWERFDVKHVTR